MKQWFKPSSYSIPVMLAILLHGGVAGLFLLQWPAAERIIKPPVPKHIIANVVATENRAVQQRQQQAQQQHAQQQKQQAADALKKKQAAEKARKQREADALALKKKQQAEAQQKKQQAQQQAEAEAQAAADAKAKAEAEEAAAAAEREQQLREEEQQLLEQLATEQAAQEMQQQQENERRAKVEAELEADFVSQVREKVERSWLYPPAVKPDQQVTVRINLVPTGEVISVVVIKGSGNTALDRSVEQAVLKASPLPVPKDVRVFERSFRTLTMVFRPENATW
ncbi:MULTISPECIES: cell envelope integrity protein TolA [unclassified Oceanobacter]|uniref:cell envelope integrity protein TolA n=1 Tax=unclassified Oceanobacter TaxID=2620260 RepID=UPI0026E3C3EE|nr:MULTISPECIES: cell envelope integrity protein TolA [unclassified Oceanobacter]MDO6682784.1 cell envelope integrity protein TolA [Oceanobacter sp. 5_MG-2023]MDP2504856.1 cell envelope integrity protein TolA [Oceanobacter sp. 3_MG-2023]MDP2546300.1 cell envelope integrity protein TolA [Oceanobacter sp. 4_MG-2023]